MDDFWRLLLVVVGGGLIGSVVFGPLGKYWEYKGPPQSERIAADKARRLMRKNRRGWGKRHRLERLSDSERFGVRGHDGGGTTAPH
jgi:hypothetical protein